MSGVFLGLNILHDTSAAIVVDNTLVAAVEQERFDRQRHSCGFPSDAIDYCLAKAGVRLDDVTGVGVSFRYKGFLWNAAPFEQHTIAHDDTRPLGWLRQVTANTRTYLDARAQLRRHGLAHAVQVPHHLAHAAGSFYLSGFPDANVLIIDGRGERHATTLLYASASGFKVLETYPVRHSLGHLYTYVTALCGLYTRIGQEGKTMGLAAYGSGKMRLDKVVSIGSRRYRINRRQMRKLKRYQVPPGEINDDSKELAHAVQAALEEVAVFLAERLYSATGCPRYVLGGGVSLNCNTNSRIAALPWVSDLFIQPAANDAGTAVGVAFLLSRQGRQAAAEGRRSDPVYLGPSYDDSAITAALRRAGVAFRRVDDPATEAAELIAGGAVVGWFQGAMELGPRALGSRSILADPRDGGIKDRINATIKYREPWRPFAPSVLAEHADAWFVDARPSPYMLLTLQLQPDKAQLVPGITHVDGTARVQTVAHQDHPLYHALLSRFHERTGVPMVLNTSLNTRGEPIACTPADAVSCFVETGLDALVAGSLVATKTDQPTNGQGGK